MLERRIPREVVSQIHDVEDTVIDNHTEEETALMEPYEKPTQLLSAEELVAVASPIVETKETTDLPLEDIEILETDLLEEEVSEPLGDIKYKRGYHVEPELGLEYNSSEGENAGIFSLLELGLPPVVPLLKESLPKPQPSRREVSHRQETLREEKRKKFWREGFQFPMQQGALGNCYAIAALWVMKENPETQNILLDNIREIKENKEWEVTFYEVGYNGTEEQVGIRVTRKDIEQTLGAKRGDSQILEQGSLGDLIYTRAYMRFLHHERGGEPEQTFLTDRKEFDEDENREVEKMLVEGGHPQKALHHFVGAEYKKFKTIINPRRPKEQEGSITNALLQICRDRENGTKEVMAMASTYRKAEMPAKTRAQKIFDFLGFNTQKVSPRHAYGIDTVLVDEKKGMQIVLVNPHDTQKRLTLSADEFQKYFNRITYLKKLEEDEDAVEHSTLVPF